MVIDAKIQWFSKDFLEGMISGNETGEFYYINDTCANQIAKLTESELLETLKFEITESVRSTKASLFVK